MQEKWWQKSVVYQIYPKSFNDTTGNGMGDINGITEKLEYIKELGVDVVWLTPIYVSPQNDNGYDIADYYKIQPDYGTMEDFEKMLEKAHHIGLKIIMDIVVNHTSTEHKWFQEAKKSKDNPYRKYYIWKDGNPDELPTNWESKFGGNAWEYDETTGSYYLHLFDVTQADLNWENEKVREDVYQMMNFWLDKGVDGFRLDVINLISKDQHFPNDDGSVAPGDGRKFYTDGPRVHEFLHEMNQEVFKGRETFTVGEMSSTSMEDCIKYSNPEREELDMTFNFHHLKVDYPNGEKWTKAPFDFLYLKQLMSDWQTGMQEGGGWNALFWCNHDQPRIVSRFGDDTIYHKESAKMLATTIHMMQGTPYIYQGEEIGMTNAGFDDISQYRDVESLNMYKIKKAEGLSDRVIIEILQEKSRDNARTPMQWNNTANAGFTDGNPWIGLPDNYQKINAEAAIADKTSIYYHYQRLIQLRKEYQVITDGKYQLILPNDFAIFAYIRENKDTKLLVVNNFYAKESELNLPEAIRSDCKDSKILLSNYEGSPSLASDTISLRPYESIVYYLKK
ncbi:alpha,alpha-phosphotrehalase [Gracilibacillus alcaliphilus]|uniref:alpha,alpha-phosphotrehalase n=1 Tax=Gracilibacillus alcaliphilus TaxID=1401441 RepID=UPI00195E729C|nr:alpha,alpha-phosphotrehalase [Gracilibacillus alcaliphilus]MBM7677732.1 trehalose-6-phosphate hydrolase [Gracilibacillus alcaliphilus]